MLCLFLSGGLKQVSLYIKCSLTEENMFWGFDEKGPNQPTQLQRLARNQNFARSWLDYCTCQMCNNKGADQTVWIRRLVALLLFA